MKKLDIGYDISNTEIRYEKLYRSNLPGLRVAFLSDLHLNKFGNKLTALILESLIEENPDLVLLGGDYVDSKNGLKHLDFLFATIGERFNCVAIPGNHDTYFGIEKIKRIAINSGITWCDTKVEIQIRGHSVSIDSISEVESYSESDLNILLLHEPIKINLIRNPYDLIFAGHLHGCQFVLWQKEQYLYPGAYFYQSNFLKHYISDDSLYLISKGLGDTLPIRYNCLKDIIVVDFVGNSHNNAPPSTRRL